MTTAAHIVSTVSVELFHHAQRTHAHPQASSATTDYIKPQNLSFVDGIKVLHFSAAGRIKTWRFTKEGRMHRAEKNHSMKAGGNRLAMRFKSLFKCLGHDSEQTSGWKLYQPSLRQPSSWEKWCFWSILLGNPWSKSSAPLLRLHGTPLALWTFWLFVYTDNTGKDDTACPQTCSFRYLASSISFHSTFQ